MPNLRPTELILILAIILLLFGAKKLPALAKSIGQSLKVFRKETADMTEADGKAEKTEQDVAQDATAPATAAAPAPVAPAVAVAQNVTAQPAAAPVAHGSAA